MQNEHVLILSGGDNVTNRDDREVQRQSEVYLRLLGKVGIDASAVQSQDLIAGLDALQTQTENYGIPYICANLVNEGEPVLEGYRIFELGGVKLGVLAVTDPNMQHSNNKMPKGFKFVEPHEAVVSGVETLKEELACDAVVLLYGGRRDQAIESCNGVAGLDLIMFGNGTMSQRVPAETDLGTPIYSAASKGKDFGELLLSIDDEGVVEISPILIHELDKNYEDDPEILAEVNQYKSEAKARRDRAKLIEDLAREYSETPVTETFLGSEMCARCHEAEAAVFKASAHAKAMLVLEEAGEETNPECISCHVTGWSVAGGYGLNARNRNMLIHVQCEACHGYGTAHKRNDPALRLRAREVCLDCHNQEWSPDFDFDSYWQQIKH